MSANLVMVPARSFLGTVESLGCLYGATQVTFPSRPERKKRALHFAGTHAPLPPIHAMLKWAARTYVQVSASEKNVHFLLTVIPWVALNIAWGGRADSSTGEPVKIESARFFRSGRTPRSTC